MLDHLSDGRVEPGVDRTLEFSQQCCAYDDGSPHVAPAQPPLTPAWYAGNIESAAQQGMNGLGRPGKRSAYAAYRKTFEAGRVIDTPLFQREPRVGSARHKCSSRKLTPRLATWRGAAGARALRLYAAEVMRALAERRVAIDV